MGGVHAAIMSDEALKHVDVVVKGEGELSMLKIVHENIDHGIIQSPFIKNIDEIPPPALHLMDINFYLSPKEIIYGKNIRAGSIITSRACPFRCIFCYNRWRDTPVRYHSPERVIEEIKIWIDNYQVKGVFFFDDSFLTKKNRLVEICELIKENGLHEEIVWQCQARVDQVDLEKLKMIKDAGCIQVGFGFESGSQRILSILKNKTTTVEQNKKAIELCKKEGLSVLGSFMIGNPTETIEDLKKTEQFICENDIDFRTTPFPGTKLWDWCQSRGLIKEPYDITAVRIIRDLM